MAAVLLWALPLAAFSGFAKGPLPAVPTSVTTRTVAVHAASGADEPIERLDVAAPSRALPKKEDGAAIDPLGLWETPKNTGPKGASAYNLNRGRAIDTLRRDYPQLLDSKPDMSIFTKGIELHDPSGKRLSGMKQYERVFDALRFLRRTTMQDAEMTYRIVVVDEAIRVRWSLKMWMRDPALGLTNMVTNGEPALVHIDGVSNYDLNDDGLIYRHRLENIILRGQSEAAPLTQLNFAWPTAALATPPVAIPFFRGLDAALPEFFDSVADAARDVVDDAKQQYFDTRGGAGASTQRRGGDPSMAMGETPFERAARERAEDAAASAARLESRAAATKKQKPKDGLVELFSRAMPQPCETSYDCESPEVCCDLVFTSVCCSGGMMMPQVGLKQQLQQQAIPIPIERDDGPQAPRGGAPGGPMGPGANGYPPN